MKKFKSIVAIALIACMPFAFSSCEETGDESCEQQDMNEVMNCGAEKNVEVCCTEGAACVYKYNGTDYPDNVEGLNNLADALGCTYKSSPAYEDEKALIIKYLKGLKERALAGN
jgi:hypothetical protein